MVRRIIQWTNARRKLHAKNAKVRNTVQSSALRILHQTQYACSVEKQGIQLRNAEPARKLRRRLGHKSQSPPEATCIKPIDNSYWTDARPPHLSTEFDKTPDARTSSFTVWYPPLIIGQRLQQLVMSADGVAALPMSRGIPPLAYPGREGMDHNQAYSTAGSTHSIPTLAPGMYGYTNV